MGAPGNPQNPTLNPPQKVGGAEGLFPTLQDKTSPPDTFDLGLVLGGTVSAGAYTAGALDYLLEALDSWYSAKVSEVKSGIRSEAHHKINIRIVTGASGGAVCASILAVLANRGIVPITDSRSPDANNPLWKIWVENLDIAGFAQEGDLGPSVTKIPSVLNPAPLEASKQTIVNFATSNPGSFRRPYFEDPVRLVITHSNLRGIPYGIEVNGWQGSPGAGFVEHNDYVRIAVPSDIDRVPQDWDASHTGGANKRPDEFWIQRTSVSNDDGFVDWRGFAEFALASAAFPVGLPAREVNKPLSHYLYRTFTDWSASDPADPKSPIEPHVTWLVPDWDSLAVNHTTLESNYNYVSVDGGVFNNDPIYLARTWLSGGAGRNPRDAKVADRAILLIDPLASKKDNDCSKNVSDDLIGALWPIVQGSIGGARYLTSDLMLMADPTIFSRFQLVPIETRVLDKSAVTYVGDLAVFSSSLMAFGGFTHRDFRAHDFMLGRVNMQKYLRQEFVLHRSNPIFKWNDDDLRRWGVDANGNRQTDLTSDDFYMPLIPDLSLQAGMAIDQGLPWDKVPQPAPFDPAGVNANIRARLKYVISKLQQLALPGLGYKLLGLLVEPAIAKSVTDKLISTLVSDLKDRGLTAVTPPPADPWPADINGA